MLYELNRIELGLILRNNQLNQVSMAHFLKKALNIHQRDQVMNMVLNL